jgi:hypothetical protein
MDMPQNALSTYAKYWPEENHDRGRSPYPNQGQSSGVGASESCETESCMSSLFVDQEGKKQGTTVGYLKSSTSRMFFILESSFTIVSFYSLRE